jgi:hypothetical protein
MHDAVDLIADVFAGRVLDGAMVGKLFAGLGVEVGPVGMERGLAVDVANQYLANVGLGCVLDVEGADFAAALDQRND